jgi:ABC-2 type transport system ATP-binding protein
MHKLGKKQLTLRLREAIESVPDGLGDYNLQLADSGRRLVYTFDTKTQDTGVAELLRKLGNRGIEFTDLDSVESSLEDIFVTLVGHNRPGEDTK